MDPACLKKLQIDKIKEEEESYDQFIQSVS